MKKHMLDAHPDCECRGGGPGGAFQGVGSGDYAEQPRRTIPHLLNNNALPTVSPGPKQTLSEGARRLSSCLGKSMRDHRPRTSFTLVDATLHCTNVQHWTPGLSKLAQLPISRVLFSPNFSPTALLMNTQLMRNEDERADGEEVATSLAEIVRDLGSNDYDTRVTATNRLIELVERYPFAFDLVLCLFDHPDPEIRGRARLVSEQIGQRDSRRYEEEGDQLQREVADLVSAAQALKDAGEQEAAINTMDRAIEAFSDQNEAYDDALEAEKDVTGAGRAERQARQAAREARRRNRQPQPPAPAAALPTRPSAGGPVAAPQARPASAAGPRRTGRLNFP